MSRVLQRVADLADLEIDRVLDRADHHRVRRRSGRFPGRLVGLVFLETSLRTRVGFASAAHRLGASPIEVLGPRASEVSMPESWEDTVRTVSGYCDLIVTRVNHPLDLRRVPSTVSVPVINGGDRGPHGEHPSQALIDAYALVRRFGGWADLTIALCGDLSMRAARSLLALLARRPPRRLVVVSDPQLTEADPLPPELVARTERRPLSDLSGVDVLYVVGIPHGALPESGRIRLRVTTETLSTLSTQSVVLSPLPVIDEMDRDTFADPRVQVFEQSDDGLYVRMALLELLFDSS